MPNPMLFNNRLVVSKTSPISRKTVKRSICTISRLSIIFSSVLAASFYLAKEYPDKLSQFLGITCEYNVSSVADASSFHYTTKGVPKGDANWSRAMMYDVALLSTLARALFDLNALDNSLVPTSTEEYFDEIGTDGDGESGEGCGFYGTEEYRQDSYERTEDGVGSNCDGILAVNDSLIEFIMLNPGNSENTKDGSPQKRFPCGSHSVLLRMTGLDPYPSGSSCRTQQFHNSNVGVERDKNGICISVANAVHQFHLFEMIKNCSVSHVAQVKATNQSRRTLEKLARVLQSELLNLSMKLLKYLSFSTRLSIALDCTSGLNPTDCDFEYKIVHNWNHTMKVLRDNPRRSGDLMWRMLSPIKSMGMYRSWFATNFDFMRHTWNNTISSRSRLEFVEMMACEVLKPMCLLAELGEVDIRSVFDH